MPVVFLIGNTPEDSGFYFPADYLLYLITPKTNQHD